jgi:hypothetical protein
MELVLGARQSSVAEPTKQAEPRSLKRVFVGSFGRMASRSFLSVVAQSEMLLRAKRG